MSEKEIQPLHTLCPHCMADQSFLKGTGKNEPGQWVQCVGGPQDGKLIFAKGTMRLDFIRVNPHMGLRVRNDLAGLFGAMEEVRVVDSYAIRELFDPGSEDRCNSLIVYAIYLGDVRESEEPGDEAA